MKRRYICFLLILVFCASSKYTFSQITTDNKQKAIFEEVKKRPDLGVDISKITKLKIFLPKETYQLQETMILDLGLLVESNEAYFFPEDLNVKIIIRDKQKNKVLIDTIYSIDKEPNYEIFKTTIIRNSTQLLVGCKNKVMNEIDESSKVIFDDNLKAGFEKNLFRSFPHGCIDINNASELEISAEVYNDLVVVSQDKEKIKTAVGNVKSNILKINVKY